MKIEINLDETRFKDLVDNELAGILPRMNSWGS